MAVTAKASNSAADTHAPCRQTQHRACSERVVAHAKSNLAQMGSSQTYTLKGGGFAWAGRSSLSAEDLGGPPPDADQQTCDPSLQDMLKVSMLICGSLLRVQR